MIQRRVIITGTVQGVGFRAATVAEARKHSRLYGLVRNLEDGSVEAIFAGEESDVLKLVAWCRKGPPSAQVQKLEVYEEEVNPSLRPFEISRKNSVL